MEQVKGYIERITFQSMETGFTVASLKEPQKRDLTCIVGSMPDIQPGETIRCTGFWKNHPVYGWQFDVKNYSIDAPADIIGITKYLSSGLIKGIGNIYAARIVKKFGVDTLNIIDQSPEKLLEVNGIGRIRVAGITACWEEHKAVREVMIFLQQYGVNPSYAQKIFKTYRDASIDKVKDNPYHLAKDIFGIGFKTADKIALAMGITKDSSKRIDSGIEFTLSELSNDGHTCFPVLDFLNTAKEKLEVDLPKISARLSTLQSEDRIVIEPLVHNDREAEDFIWLKPFYVSETGIVKEINRLLGSKSNIRTIIIDKAIEWVEKKLNIKLAQAQKAALGTVLVSKIHIITGSPGTGKSTIINSIIKILSKITDKILLSAPTGRAAKRLTEITAAKASTIHSLLEFDFSTGRFKNNRDNPLKCDVIIVDEASMIDTFLLYNLLKAIPDTAQLILAGDINQLPSVGAGNTLKDLMSSNKISVSELTEIYRQAKKSKIIVNAHRINSGLFPDITIYPDSDFFYIKEADPEKINEIIVDLVTRRIPDKYNYDPFEDIQVLSPMKKGIIGTISLNETLQKSLNLCDEPLLKLGKCFAAGDKVMQVRNNYDKQVFNGDIGIISKIDKVDQKLFVNIDSKEIKYEFSELDELVLSYAVSVHKYQGSECPCIIIPVHTSHYMLLCRNLLYTAVTRGKKLVVLVGTTKAIAVAVKNNDVKNRYSGLLSKANAISELN
ncbi:MAG: ATP-dependent RecD-like DNA helicase [bacterium]|nr:ATP-dependent RecD-like DNA helicase [bacterium]